MHAYPDINEAAQAAGPNWWLVVPLLILALVVGPWVADDGHRRYDGVLG